MKCKICHREIKNPKSVQHGYGPVCWIKMQKSNNDNGEPDKYRATEMMGETMAKNMVKLIKEFERQESGHRTALVRIRSRYAIVEWNYHLKKWVAGDGLASTPDRAVQGADYDTLLLFKTQKEALSKVVYFFGR